jgi:hypothetical protein
MVETNGGRRMKVKLFSRHYEEWTTIECKSPWEIIGVLLHEMESEGLIVEVEEE